MLRTPECRISDPHERVRLFEVWRAACTGLEHSLRRARASGTVTEWTNGHLTQERQRTLESLVDTIALIWPPHIPRFSLGEVAMTREQIAAGLPAVSQGPAQGPSNSLLQTSLPKQIGGRAIEREPPPDRPLVSGFGQQADEHLAMVPYAGQNKRRRDHDDNGAREVAEMPSRKRTA
jgi:hypothetical protein